MAPIYYIYCHELQIQVSAYHLCSEYQKQDIELPNRQNHCPEEYVKEGFHVLKEHRAS